MIDMEAFNSKESESGIIYKHSGQKALVTSHTKSTGRTKVHRKTETPKVDRNKIIRSEPREVPIQFIETAKRSKNSAFSIWIELTEEPEFTRDRSRGGILSTTRTFYVRRRKKSKVQVAVAFHPSCDSPVQLGVNEAAVRRDITLPYRGM